MLSNKEISRVLKLAQQLFELHGANPFKVKGYASAIYTVEQASSPVADFAKNDDLPRIGIKGKMADKINTILETGTFPELDELIETTPKGVIEVLNVKGLGAKKVKTLWEEHNIDSVEKLKEACEQGELASMKGFGEKTQAKILEGILFSESQQGFFMYAEIMPTANELKEELSKISDSISFTGDIARQLPVVETIQFVCKKSPDTTNNINTLERLEYNKKESGPFVWRGKDTISGASIEIILSTSLVNDTITHSSSEEHLSLTLNNGKSIYKELSSTPYESETQFYNQFGFHLIPSYCREGQIEHLFKQDKEALTLIQPTDMVGTLHNHSTYSDGKHTLAEMANKCIELGLTYLGISDHSKTATYARGLDESRIIQQHEEIDKLNAGYDNFKIFKGIESDILTDGSLDYADDVLKSFDFIVASIHSGLEMDINKATNRLITAIENPYTTILGHPTGRLLTRREGYPIDHKKVIDACADNNVVIEINSNPWRLDIDWKWVSYCIEKGVMLSINPDAHEMDGFHDMYFGTLIGQKGGLTKEMNLNSMSLEQIETYFSKKK